MINIEEQPAPTGLEIAVIGMAGSFPGAVDIDEFWENIKNGVESLSFYTDQELTEAGVPLEVLENPAFVKAKGGVLENKKQFDAAFFGYTPLEASVMDPQLRKLHECVWTALENAGYDTETYDGLIGLYAGASANFYWEVLSFMSGKRDELGEFAASQLTGREFFATSISYKLNLKGPGFNVLTACSTSLAAIHLACQSLLNGECHIALAGGVSIHAQESHGYFFQEGMINSSDGHCRAFDAQASGTVSGEGVGIVVLKTLEDALADRDYIHAVVKGTAVNNDGMRKGGYAAPSIMGQAEAIRAALQVANVAPESIGYIEAHGTGTTLGDPIEIEALNMAFSTAKKNFCAIGSIKTNIGHLDAAAGVAGFIKAVLVLKHGLIPPTLHFTSPNPKINFKNSPFYVTNSLKEWQNNPRCAGVSSFGIGGTNVHVVLEEYKGALFEKTAPLTPAKTFDYLFLLSAKTQNALELQTLNLINYMKKNPDVNPADIAYTLQIGRRPFKYRRMAVCSNPLETTFSDDIAETQDRPVIFMFPGQGSQYVNMALNLYQTEPIFHAEMDHCFDILRTLTTYDLKKILYPTPGDNKPDIINQTDITQPVIFMIEYALARLLMHWGIKPQAMIGHSIGEYVAAHLAGVFSLGDVLELVVVRGKLMQQILTGAMLSVPLPETELHALLEKNQNITIAAVNTPSQCVLSGPHDAIQKFSKELQENGHETRLLHTSHAFHSAMMDPIIEEFKKNFAQIAAKTPEIPYISNVSGTWITVEEATNPEYWAQHLRETVRFSDGAGELLKLENAVFIEIGPGKTLSAFVTQHPDKADHHRVLNLVRHPHEQAPDQKYLMEKLGTLWLYGKAIDWHRYHDHEKRYRLPLPTYPFEQKTYWLELEGDPLQWGNAGKNVLKATVPTDDIIDATYATGKPYAAPENETENMLVHIWQDFFGIKKISVQDDFFQLGGDSLKATAMIAKIHKAFNVLMPLKEIFNTPTVRGLAGYIKKAEQVKYKRLETVEEREYYMLSPAQKRLYILYRLAEDSTGYNLPEVGILEGEIDEAKFARTFNKLINRHESLRTAFIMVKGEPVQRVSKVFGSPETFFQKGFWPPEAIKDFIRPFDLSNAPLLRVGLFKVEEEKHILIIDMHHIISDGTSLGIFKKEFMSFYEKKELPGLKLQYKDYSAWQNELILSGEMKKKEEYWLKQFAGEVPVLNLPYDYHRPPLQRYEGRSLGFEIDEIEAAGLNRMAVEEKATLFMVLLALFDILLSRLSGMEGIIVGVPVAGRTHPDVEQIIGMFVNTLALRNAPNGEATFLQFLAEIKKSTLEAFENQDYPFEDLVDQVAVKRDISRNPLFDVMFTLQNVESPVVEIPGLKLLPYNYENKTVHFDLSLQVVEAEKKLYLKFEYNLELFAAATIERFIYYFKRIVSGVLPKPDGLIAGLEIISEEERGRLLYDFNDTAVDYPSVKTIHQLFAEQVEQTPDHMALVGCLAFSFSVRPVGPVRLVQLSYRQLNEQSNRLAGLLVAKGVLADSIVGIMMERSVEMVIAIIGIIKAGGAYMPIDPRYPQERIAYMLKDSAAKILLTPAECDFTVQHSLLSTHHASQTNHLAYLIYTSGSTGTPKGTAVEHASVVNLLFAMQRKYPLRERDVYLLKTSYMFDVSVTELFGWFFEGGRLIVLEKDGEKDPGLILDNIERHFITHINFVPSMFNAFVDVMGPASIRKLCGLKYIFLAGEALLPGIVEKFRRYALTVRLENIYGPTEAAVYSAWYSLAGWVGGSVPIGKPLANVGLLVLDRAGNYQPVGVPGELCITGVGLARGYLNRPELTSERFIFYRSYKSYRTHITYKTGDLARWLSDGNIEYLGRVDRQVKIRGYRIELGEIEDKLSSFEGVLHAVVLTKEIEPGHKELVAYIVSKNQIALRTLKDYLEKHLPGYMIPSYYHFPDQIPLLPNGKIDRKTLETYDLKLSLEIEYTPPENDVEKAITAAWEEVLNLENIGIHNNFFDAGGNSLKIIRLNAQLKEIFKKDIAVTALFEHTTIYSQAKFLQFIQPGSIQDNPPDREPDRTEEINKGKTRLTQRMQRRGEVTDD